ncbi:MAG: TonB family protein [Deltaproteobacteria bacterium]|nr:TonB family protein [Deltaproteobacteria bacterium]
MNSKKNFKNTGESYLTPMDHTGRTRIIFFSVSVILHGLFFAGLIMFQDFKRPKPLPPVIQIDLVSFAPEPAFEEPAKNENNSKNEGIAVKTTIVKKKARKIPTIKPDISLKTKPKNLKDLMAEKKKKKKEPARKKPAEKKKPKRRINPDKTLEEAREKLAKKVEDQNQDRIAQVLSRLQKKVMEQGKTNDRKSKGSGAGYGKKGYKPIDLYNLIIGSTIEQNWVFNDILARMDQNLEVRILIKILKSGEIRDIIYETKSGNHYLDESAKKAIKKANPLPRLPAGLHSYDVGLIFTPKGLK